MAEVTETCLLPDMLKNDPREFLRARGWQLNDQKFEKRLDGSVVVVEVHWPASKRAAASCSFATSTVTASEAYNFFHKRIGSPNGIPWSEKSVASWKIDTNGHGVGIYVSRGFSGGETPGLLLHILQG